MVRRPRSRVGHGGGEVLHLPEAGETLSPVMVTVGLSAFTSVPNGTVRAMPEPPMVPRCPDPELEARDVLAPFWATLTSRVHVSAAVGAVTV